MTTHHSPSNRHKWGPSPILEKCGTTPSLAEVRKARCVTMDSSNDAAFHVHFLDWSSYTRFKDGLYLHGTSEGKMHSNKR
jgi:hypothetical protein